MRKSIGFLTSDIKLDPQFTPDYMFEFFGRLHGVSKEVLKERKEQLFEYFGIKDFAHKQIKELSTGMKQKAAIAVSLVHDPEIVIFDVLKERKEQLFEYFGIKDFAHKQIKELSTGMKQKAAIAVSLVHDPEIVIFDEPTNGLDIVTARGVTDYLKKLREEGKLVIVSTHIMSEAEKLCDRIGVIIDGQKVSEGTLQGTLDSTGTKDLEDAFFELYRSRKGRRR